jgi:N utilization substance protein B
MAGGIGPRRRAREYALQVLFSLDLNEVAASDALERFWRDLAHSSGPGDADDPSAATPREGGEAPSATASAWSSPAPLSTAPPALDPQVVTFAESLVRGTTENQQEIDTIVQRASKNWRLERMARVDRNVLRLATYELCHVPDVPAKVVINEAIEVAKRFGAQESAAFVNGILDRISQELKRS